MPAKQRSLALICLCGILLQLLAGSPARAAAAGAAAISDVQVSHDSFAAHSEPAVAENPRNPRNLIAASKFFSDTVHYRFKIGTFYSTDGGKTWHDSGLLPGFSDYSTTSDVSIAFAADGTAYVSVLACDGGICPGDGTASGVFVSRSTNGGRSFSAPVPVYLDTSGATFSDKPWIAVDDTAGPYAGSIYVAWNLDPLQSSSACDRGDGDARLARSGASGPAQGGIAVSRSSDGGQTFSPPVVVYPFTSQQDAIGAVPAVSPDGRVSVVYSTYACGAHPGQGIGFVTSTDGGASFGPPAAVQKQIDPLPLHLKNGTFRNTSMPAFAISPTDGSMVVAWADMRHGDADILASRSTDSGKTWSDPVRVNHDHPGNGKDQFQPALAVAPDGAFTCAWFDRRRDPANRLIDEEIAQSTDGGKSFGHNFRVTLKSWDPAIGAPEPESRPNNTFIGDYQGLAVDNRTVHPLWNDTQNGRSQQVRTAVISTRLFVRR